MGILKHPVIKVVLIVLVTVFALQKIEPLRKLVYGAA